MGLTIVDLSFSDEQRQLVDSFAALFARESTSERVRAAEPLGFDLDCGRRCWRTASWRWRSTRRREVGAHRSWNSH